MSSKVVIVGVGALGSHVVQFLRNVDADMKVIDFDVVEMKNVASQFHAKNSVRKKKVQGLKQTMQFLFGKKLDVVSNKLTADNVEQLLSSADLVIDCLDNAESRTLVQKYCRESPQYAGIPCLHGALDAEGSFGRVVWSEKFAIDQEGAEGQATCEDGEFLPFIAVTAAYVARSAQQYLEKDRKVSYQITPAGVVTL